MPAPTSLSAATRAYLRALLTGDADLLASISLAHPHRGTLLAGSRREATAALLADVGRAPIASKPLGSERHLVTADLGGVLHVLVLHDTPGGPRVDLRYPLAALQPDDERRCTARAFHRAMLLGDLHALRRLAFDDRGLETLVDDKAPRGADEPLLAAVQAMPLVELGLGEPFVVPSGVQFVNARHLEMGIAVLGGLTPGGEIPFLLRQRSGEWKVIPFHFLQAATAARAASAS